MNEFSWKLRDKKSTLNRNQHNRTQSLPTSPIYQTDAIIIAVDMSGSLMTRRDVRGAARARAINNKQRWKGTVGYDAHDLAYRRQREYRAEAALITVLSSVNGWKTTQVKTSNEGRSSRMPQVT